MPNFTIFFGFFLIFLILPANPRIIFQENFENPLRNREYVDRRVVKIIKKGQNQRLNFKLNSERNIEVNLGFAGAMAFQVDLSINNSFDLKKAADSTPVVAFLKILDSAREVIFYADWHFSKMESPELVINQLGKPLGSVPFATGSFHRLKMVRISKKILFYLDGRVIAETTYQKDFPKWAICQFGVLYFSRFFKSLEGNYSLDNLIFSDSREFEIKGPPEFSGSQFAPGKALIRPRIRPSDSLFMVEFFTSKETLFPLFRTFFTAESSKYTNDFPLISGTYYFRGRSILKNGFETDFSELSPIVISKNQPENFFIKGVSIIDELNDRPVENLEMGKSYILQAKLSHVKSCFAVFWLHSHVYQSGIPAERGGHFDRRMNYIFNFSMGETDIFYASREDKPGFSIPVEGKRYLYIDDRDGFFRVDTIQKTVRVRFKLMDEVIPGPWQIKGFIEMNKNNRSPLMTRDYRVLSELEVMARSKSLQKIKRNSVKWIFAGVFLTTIAALFFFWLWKKPTREPPRPVRLTKVPFFLKSEDFKHRHLVIKGQQFIYESYGKNISHADVAAALNLSQAWIGRIFKQATGMTIVQFITQVRVEHAQKLLAETDLPILDIAMKVGYTSADHFGRVFRTQTGETATSYRKKG